MVLHLGTTQMRLGLSTVISQAFMLALLIAPATAEPLYFSCNGIHKWQRANQPPNSAPETISVILDLDQKRFGWTATNMGVKTVNPGEMSPSCFDPTFIAETYPKNPKYPKKGPFQKRIYCSEAWARDLLYWFVITENVVTLECHEEGPEGCTDFTEKDEVDSATRGTIDRLTGELSASRGFNHWVNRSFKEEESSSQEWHMKCESKKRF
jgi:hypothetical protein